MHLYNKVDIVWGFQNFYFTHLVVAIEFTDEKYSLHTSIEMLKFNLSTVENIDYQVNHSGYEKSIPQQDKNYNVYMMVNTVFCVLLVVPLL